MGYKVRWAFELPPIPDMEDLMLFKDCHGDRDMQIAMFKHFDDQLDPLRDFMHEHSIVPTKVEFQWHKNYEWGETRVIILFEVEETERFLLVMKFG